MAFLDGIGIAGTLPFPRAKKGFIVVHDWHRVQWWAFSLEMKVQQIEEPIRFQKGITAQL